MNGGAWVFIVTFERRWELSLRDEVPREDFTTVEATESHLLERGGGAAAQKWGPGASERGAAVSTNVGVRRAVRG